MGGHLDPTVATARNLVRAALSDLRQGDSVVVAVSGGADSLALASAVAFVAPKLGLGACAVIVDHGLQAGSAEVAERAATQVRGLGLDAQVVVVQVGSAGGPEAAARHARYEALAAQDAAAVLLAHTLDDQAETVLLGLGRGSGPRSLSGMAPITGLYRRPFLTLTRAETERVCVASGLDWWNDPHNTDPAYRRVRVRKELLPLMEDVLGGGVAAALGRTASLARMDTDYLDGLAADIATESLAGLALLPVALRTRVLRSRALAEGAAADELTHVHVSELDRLLTDWHGQGGVELPGGVTASRAGDSLVFAPTGYGRLIP
ncbi:tRNA lysidine(34) synthetase TilS [soil metagenome]